MKVKSLKSLVDTTKGQTLNVKQLSQVSGGNNGTNGNNFRYWIIEG